MRRLIAFAGGVLLGASALGAQPLPARTDVGVRFGQQVFAKSAALEPSAMVGFGASWQLPWQPLSGRMGSSSFGVGVSLDVSRPRTKGEQFPLVAFDHGDTTVLYAMAQRVTLVEASVQGQLGVPIADARAIAYVGGGFYSLFLGVRPPGRSRSVAHPMANFGMAVDDPLTRTLSLRLQVGATTFMQFDRSALDASLSFPAERRISDAASAPAAMSRTPTNLQYSIGFRFTPGGK